MKRCKLGDLVSIQSGDSPATMVLSKSGRIPYVKVEDMNNCQKYQNESREYTDDSSRAVPKGAIIFPKRGAAIMNNKVRIANRPLCMDTNMMAIIPKDEIDSEYLYYVMVSEKLSRIADTSTIPQINNKHINPYKVSFPPLPEQRAIADLLSTWDSAIEKTERLIDAKKKTFTGFIEASVFGESRIGGIVSKTMIEGPYYSYPNDWVNCRIGEIADEVSMRPSREQLPVLTCSKYVGFVNSLDYFGKKVFSTDTSNYKVVQKGQFGFPSNHIEEGSIGLLEHAEVGIVSPIYVVFKVNAEKVYAPYLYVLFKTNIFRHLFKIATSSSVDRRGNLRWDEFSKIRVPLPSLVEQKGISETLSIYKHEIELLKDLAGKQRRQKQGLMQRLLSGEWRVKGH